MAYTTTTLVTNEIGTNYDSTNDLTNAQVTAFIAQADGIIDAAASQYYHPFNATDSSATDGTDTYTTPALVAKCSKDLAVAFGLQQLKARRSNTAHSDTIESYMNQADLTLGMLKNGEFVWTGIYRAFSLTFGDNDPSWELDDDQSFINPSSLLDSGDPPHILRDTLYVDTATGMTGTASQLRNGRDFRVYWSPEWRQWVFEKIHSDLDDASTVSVTFKWDYRKDYAHETMGPTVLNAG